MTCPADQVITQSDLNDLKADITTIDDVVESSLDTTTTKNNKVINTLLGQLKLLGFIPPITYAASIVFTTGDNTKTVDEAGVIYAPLPSALPFTTSGTFIGDDDARFFVVQGLTATSLPAELYPLADARYSPVFGSVADMVALNTIDGTAFVPVSGQLIRTTSRSSLIPFDAINEGSGDEFRVMTVAEYGLTPDEVGKSFTLTGGAFIAVSTAYLAILGRYGNDTAGAQAAINGGHNLEINKPATFATSVNITTPIRVTGQNTKSKITVPTSGTLPAFDISGTGGTTREKVRLEHLDFDGGNDTCIKAVSVNPFELNDIRFATGKAALDMATLFYGSCRDAIFLSSGAALNNVNNFDFVGTDANGAQAVASGRFLATDYGWTLVDCDGVQFGQMTFESWTCNVMSLIDCKSISFPRTHFEANISERILLLVDCENISFTDGGVIQLEVKPSDSFIQVANTNPSNSRRVITAITMTNQAIFLTQSGTAPTNLVKTSNTAGAGKAVVAINDCTLAVGLIHIPDLNTEVRIKNLALSSATSSSDTRKGVIAMDTVDVSMGQFSSWVPSNDNTQWDFTVSDGGFTESPGVGSTVSVVTSMPAGAPALTGVNALKVATTGAVGSNMLKLMDDSGPTTISGETYIIAVKVWADVTCTAKLRLVTNAIVPVDDLGVVSIGGNEWRWLFLKSSSVNTEAIKNSGLDPNLRIDFVTTEATNIFIDRADFQIVNGDHFLP